MKSYSNTHCAIMTSPSIAGTSTLLINRPLPITKQRTFSNILFELSRQDMSITVCLSFWLEYSSVLKKIVFFCVAITDSIFFSLSLSLCVTLSLSLYQCSFPILTLIHCPFVILLGYSISLISTFWNIYLLDATYVVNINIIITIIYTGSGIDMMVHMYLENFEIQPCLEKQKIYVFI
jgi:hypothetical protein